VQLLADQPAAINDAMTTHFSKTPISLRYDFKSFSHLQSKSKLLYSRWSASQCVLVSNLLWNLLPDITSCRNIVVWKLSSRSAVCSAITQWSESHRTHNHTLLSNLRLPQPGRPGFCIYTPQEQGGPVIPLGTGFPLRCLLQFAGLQWRYSNPSPHKIPFAVDCFITF
jgi:hypothetical protein